MAYESTSEKRSEAGKKGNEALQETHDREGLSEREREQRREAGRKGGEH
jgi:general stress protein YciG